MVKKEKSLQEEELAPIETDTSVSEGENDTDSLEKDIDNSNMVSGKVQLVTKRFVKCMIDQIKHEGRTYKRGDEISMTEQEFAKLAKYGHRFEDL